MLKNLRYIYIILFGLLLVGCKQTSKEIYLMRHPAKFKTILQQCSVSQVARQSEECVFAMSLYEQEMRLVQELVNNPIQYGKDILSLQIKQGAFQEQILQVKKAMRQPNLVSMKRMQLTQSLQQYQQKLDDVIRQIQMRLTLLAMAEKM